jgi:threonine synthase
MVRALNDGIYAAGAAHHTLSPSMDIQVASNFERALFEASGRDADWTAAAMNDFTRDKKLVLPPKLLAELRDRYGAFASSDEETLATIRRVHEQTGRILDPHTAVAAGVASRAGTGPVVILSTAHPAKFPEAVRRAIGRAPETPKALAELEKRPERMEVLANKLPLLRQFISSRLPG